MRKKLVTIGWVKMIQSEAGNVVQSNARTQILDLISWEIHSPCYFSYFSLSVCIYFSYILRGICLHRPVCSKIKTFADETGVTSPGRRPWWCYLESVRCSEYIAPISAVPTISKEIQTFRYIILNVNFIYGDGFVAGKVLSVDSQPSSWSHSEFSVCIYFHSLFRVWIWPRGSRFLRLEFSFP